MGFGRPARQMFPIGNICVVGATIRTPCARSGTWNRNATGAPGNQKTWICCVACDPRITKPYVHAIPELVSLGGATRNGRVTSRETQNLKAATCRPRDEHATIRLMLAPSGTPPQPTRESEKGPRLGATPVRLARARSVSLAARFESAPLQFGRTFAAWICASCASTDAAACW